MKKTVAIFVAILACSVLCSVNAKKFKDVKEVVNGHGRCALVEGNMSVLGEMSTARLILDYSTSHVVEFKKEGGIVSKDLGPVDTYFAKKNQEEQQQWVEIQANVLETSIKKFNKHFKLKIDDTDPKYEIKLVFENIDFGSTATTAGIGFKFHEEGGAEFNGNLIITEIATGKVVLNLRINDMKGANTSAYHFTANKRMVCTIGDIFFGTYLPQLYSRNKK